MAVDVGAGTGSRATVRSSTSPCQASVGSVGGLAVPVLVLTMNAPSVYAFVSAQQDLGIIRSAGILFAGAAVLVLSYALTLRAVVLDQRRLVLLAAVSAILVPFVLPAMHERYFFPADVFALVAAFWVPRRIWYVPALLQFTSFETYQSYLFGANTRIDLRILAVLVFVALVATVAELLRPDGAVSRRPAAQPESEPLCPAC